MTCIENDGEISRKEEKVSNEVLKILTSLVLLDIHAIKDYNKAPINPMKAAPTPAFLMAAAP